MLVNDSMVDMELHFHVYVSVFAICLEFTKHRDFRKLLSREDGGKSIMSLLNDFRCVSFCPS